MEHCTKSLIAPSHCLCAKCFILLRRANNEVGKKKKVSFWKTRNNRQGSAKVARASGAGHGDDRGHLPKARAGSRGGGGAFCPDPRESHSPSSAFAGTSRVVAVAILPRRRRGLPACPADWVSRQGDRSSCDRSLDPPAARPLVGSCLDRRRRASPAPSPPLTPVTKFSIWKIRFSSIK